VLCPMFCRAKTYVCLCSVCRMFCCCRADHAASKYLKQSMKIPKVRDEGSVKETLKRGVTRFNPF
jgi:hypothetical protein